MAYRGLVRAQPRVGGVGGASGLVPQAGDESPGAGGAGGGLDGGGVVDLQQVTDIVFGALHDRGHLVDGDDKTGRCDTSEMRHEKRGGEVR